MSMKNCTEGSLALCSLLLITYYYSTNIKNSEIRSKGQRHAFEYAAQAGRTQLLVDNFTQKREAGKPEEESLLLRSCCR
jgi:hypothetical protein